MSMVRLRRLTADQASLEEYVRLHPRVKLVTAEGEPPERYQVEYRVKSLRQVGDDLRVIKSHLVEITLPRNYPRTPPQCRMLSPVFHPNIAPHAICVGDHWSAGESLKSIVVRIGEMLAYQSYNIKSPLNGEAARWVEENEDRLPLDDVSLLPEERADDDSDEIISRPAPKVPPVVRPQPVQQPIQAEPPPVPPPVPVVEQPEQPELTFSSIGPAADGPAPESEVKIRINTACSHCGKEYSLGLEYRGKKVRCKACREAFVVR